MAMETAPGSAPARALTLRVVDLLSTQVQSVRIELIGSRSSALTRLGAVLVYLPVLVIGYVLMLASLMKLASLALGWGLTLFLFGGVHLAISAWGIFQGRVPGAAKTFDVMDPEVAPSSVRAAARASTADTLPDVLSGSKMDKPGNVGAMAFPRSPAAASAARAALVLPRRTPAQAPTGESAQKPTDRAPPLSDRR